MQRLLGLFTGSNVALNADPVGKARTVFCLYGRYFNLDPENRAVFFVVGQLYLAGLPPRQCISNFVQLQAAGQWALQQAGRFTDDFITRIASELLKGRVDVHDSGSGGFAGRAMGNQHSVLQAFNTRFQKPYV